MRSTMQNVPLQVARLLQHGATLHGGSEVVTATEDGMRRATYSAVGRNAARLAHALADLGVGPGDRVATFMWNNQEHLEAYLAVPSMGAVIHPLNIRLFPEQITYIANHAEDRVVIVDDSLLLTFASILPHLSTVEHVIVNGDADPSVLPCAPSTVHRYAGLLKGRPDTYPWPDVDEQQAAGMCYTSGTTGNPKGVIYSHRSLYLHSLGISLPDMFGISVRDRVLAIVPQFHAQAWGLPYAAFLTGASLAMPDRFLGPEPLAKFIEAARPTMGAAVPTVWQGLADHLDQHPQIDISSLSEAIVGGSACPPSLMRTYDQHGVRLLHVWGMTEMSPLGTLCRPPKNADGESEWDYRQTQGRFPAPVEARLIDADGSQVPWDGQSVGELEVRGPWITGSYYLDDDPSKFHDGWLRTGDVGTITPDGYLSLTDRVKDVIKSGGEWISSVELENHLMAHPAVAEACVVGVPDDKWGERPLAIVVLRNSGQGATYQELRTFLAEKVASWQLPERWAQVPEVPKTSVGKFDKKVLRSLYADGALDVHLIA
ncbi:long-chain fatty acid--CoA ligase [Streptomyces sp. 7N604]|uniref:long-chain fatty acid--CoA ligase n=1 Tax=Streptomyces sp. 7N604 TaxID=3457415 RepID=UPI003FD34D9F